MELGVVMLRAEIVAPNGTATEALELEAGAEIHHLRHLLTINAIPMVIGEDWIPAAPLPSLLRTNPNFLVYAELIRADLVPQWGGGVIEAHTTTAQEVALFSVQEGASALNITWRTFHEHCTTDYLRALPHADRCTLQVPVAVPKPTSHPDRSSSWRGWPRSVLDDLRAACTMGY